MKLEWLVPVIVIIVYAIGWIIKAKEEIDAKANKPVGKAPGKELDRFLQEIDRLRKQQEAAPSSVSRRNEDDEFEETPRPAPVLRPVTPAPVVARPRPTPAAARPFPTAPAAPVKERPTFRPATPRQVAFAGTTGPRQRNSNMAGVLALLRNSNTVASAVILNEILGPPKSRR